MYKTEFSNAVERTQRFGLDCPNVKYSAGTAFTQQAMSLFPFIFSKHADNLVGQCLRVNLELLQPIQTTFKSPCYYTLGYLSVGDDLLFHNSEEYLKGLIDDYRPRLRKHNIHAWLTFPTMEIIDPTIVSSAAPHADAKSKGGVLKGNPDHFDNNLRYHPMIVGEDFLHKSGILVRL